jgi:hypothetical protein
MNFSFGTVMFELTRHSILHLRDLMVGSSAAMLVCDSFGTSTLWGTVFLPNSIAMVSLMHHILKTPLTLAQILFFFFNPLLHF